jgi:hypothetical protein
MLIKFKIFKAVTVHTVVFWALTPYKFLSIHTSTLKTEATYCSEISEPHLQTYTVPQSEGYSLIYNDYLKYLPFCVHLMIRD